MNQILVETVFDDWTAWYDPNGIVLVFGCEAHPITSWPHDDAARRHHPDEAGRYAAITRAVAALALASLTAPTP